jgi:hypothetical protein
MSTLSKIGGFLKKKGLPLLGAVMGGPATLVSTGIGLIADELGLETQDEDQIIKHIESNPETVYALKKLEADNKVELKKLALQGAQIDLEEQRAFLQDRGDARSREEAFVDKTGGRDWSMTILAWTTTVGFLGTVAGLLFADIPDSQILLVTIGMLGGGFSQVLSYYFGSSKGSADKNKMLKENKVTELPIKKDEDGGLG